MHNELDLGICPELAENVQRRAYCPPPPLNLRVNGNGYAPTYLAGVDITVDWDAVSGLRTVTPATQDLASESDQTVIAVHDASGVYKGEVSTALATGPLTITNADLVAILGAETDFILRGCSECGGFKTRYPTFAMACLNDPNFPACNACVVCVKNVYCKYRRSITHLTCHQILKSG